MPPIPMSLLFLSKRTVHSKAMSLVDPKAFCRELPFSRSSEGKSSVLFKSSAKVDDEKLSNKQTV